MERNERVHFEPVKEKLDHDKSRRFKLQKLSNLTMLSAPELLTATAAAWVMKPTRLKWSSPWEARATPVEIMKTMTASFLLGSWIRNVQEINRIATGVKACSGVSKYGDVPSSGRTLSICI